MATTHAQDNRNDGVIATTTAKIIPGRLVQIVFPHRPSDQAADRLCLLTLAEQIVD